MTSAQLLRLAKREHRDAIKRYGRNDVVTRDYLRLVRELASALIAGEVVA